MTNVSYKTEKGRLALRAEDKFVFFNTISVSFENVLLCSIYAYLRTVTEIHICLCCRNYLRQIRRLESEGLIPRSFSSTPTTWSGTSVEMDLTNLPTTPKDILSFAWQISKGMAYLSDMKVRKSALLTLSINRFQARSHKCNKRLLALSCLSVSLSFHTHGTSRLQQDGFSLNLTFQYFSQICHENLSLVTM
jgi:hypothetical protein